MPIDGKFQSVHILYALIHCVHFYAFLIFCWFSIEMVSVQNLEMIEMVDLVLPCKSEKKTSLFRLLKTTKTIGGYQI